MTATEESAQGRAALLQGGPYDGHLVGIGRPNLPIVVHDAFGSHTYDIDAAHIPFVARYRYSEPLG